MILPRWGLSAKKIYNPFFPCILCVLFARLRPLVCLPSAVGSSAFTTRPQLTLLAERRLSQFSSQNRTGSRRPPFGHSRYHAPSTVEYFAGTLIALQTISAGLHGRTTHCCHWKPDRDDQAASSRRSLVNLSARYT